MTSGTPKIFIGIIKSFNAVNGYGFIECGETMQQYGGDVFLHKNEFAVSGLEVGSECQFTVNVNEKNQPRASNVSMPGSELRDPTGKGQAPRAPPQQQNFGGGKGGNAGGFDNSYGMQIGGQGPPQIGPTGMYGQIKSFNQEKGFGFIDSQQAMQQFGNSDVYLHYTEAISFRVGDFIWFDVEIHGSKPRAKNLQLATAATPPQRPPQFDMGQQGYGMQQQPQQQWGGMPQQAGKGAGKGPMHFYEASMKGLGKNKGGAMWSRPGEWNETREYSGMVKSHNEQKGYGFIECDSIKQVFGRDVFIKQDQYDNNQLQVGEEVTFTVHLHNGDQPQAQILGKTQQLQQSASDKLSSLNMPLRGIIKSYNDAKGFGFIQCEEISNLFNGGDAFLHRRELENAAELVGCDVDFHIFINQSGKPQATNIVAIPGADGAGGGADLGGAYPVDGGFAEDEPAAKRQRVA